VNQEGETPTLQAVIQVALERYSHNLHTCMPASIVKYDRTKQIATVQPLLQRKTRDGVVLTYQVIQNVPCIFPRTATFGMTYELKPKDTGLLVFSERSLDKWLASKGEVMDPKDPRKFDISDAIFIPGLFPNSKPAYTEKDITILKNAQTRFRMYETGKMAFTNLASGEELIKIIHDLLIVLENALIRTAIGPQPFVPNTIQELTSIQTRLDTLLE